MATLSQVQDSVDFLNAYLGGGTPTPPASGNPIAVILNALGYYSGPLTGQISTAPGSALTTGYYKFRNDYLHENNPLNVPLTYAGGPPSIYNALHAGIQAALAAVHGSSGGSVTTSGGIPVHGGGGSSGGRTSHQNPPYSGSDQTYTVKSGDTLGDIADSLGVSLSDLEAANPQIANFDLIYPGDVIGIPGTGQGMAPLASKGGISKSALIGGGLVLAALGVVALKK